MSTTEPSAPGSPGRRRKPAGGDSIEGLAAPPPRRKGARRKSRRGGSDSGGKRGKLVPVLLGVLGTAVVVAVVVVLVIRFGFSGGTEQAAPNSYGVYTSRETTEVLADRETDPRPLAEQEVFERGNDEIDSQGMTFTLAASSLTDDCAQAVWGESVVQALADADCSQVARAGYTSEDHVGVAAILKLRDADAARAVAAALEPPDGEEEAANGFLLPPSEEEPFDRLGAGYSAAEATVNGHYLVVTWVQSLSSTSPEERENLSGPLIALGNFDFPLFRRLLEHDTATGTGTEGTTGTGTEVPGTGTQDGTAVDPGAGTGGTTGVDGGTGTGVDGTGTGTGVPTG
ncbi:hypothetical protein [Marinactinospora rubrisoli]|uniref:Uncharacterized protein n=1 Tax=Marinactinospora rubrisoli TaxID=2715399 RepID=A0ABW2KEN6_9ACTN